MKKITLKAARANLNLTQSEAAQQLGVSKDTLSNWENGRTSPNVEKFRLIEQIYGVSYDELDFLPQNTRNA